MAAEDTRRSMLFFDETARHNIRWDAQSGIIYVDLATGFVSLSMSEARALIEYLQIAMQEIDLWQQIPQD